jgi:hypothetical protein
VLLIFYERCLLIWARLKTKGCLLLNESSSYIICVCKETREDETRFKYIYNIICLCAYTYKIYLERFEIELSKFVHKFIR